jgi:hypothetical protein
VTPVKEAVVKGKLTGSGTAGMAVAHYGSNNMIAFRYKLKSVPMKVAEKSFTADGVDFPAGSFVIAPGGDMTAVKTAVELYGLTAAALSQAPTVAMHDADVPRVAIYSSWNNTQEIGWYRHAFDQFGIPFDLIFKERLKKGNLRADYDVVLMPTQQANRAAVLAGPSPCRPKTDKFKFLGDYGSSPDITGGMGGDVDASPGPRRRQHAHLHQPGRTRRNRSGAHGRRVRANRRILRAAADQRRDRRAGATVFTATARRSSR